MPDDPSDLELLRSALPGHDVVRTQSDAEVGDVELAHVSNAVSGRQDVRPVNERTAAERFPAVEQNGDPRVAVLGGRLSAAYPEPAVVIRIRRVGRVEGAG